MEIVPLFDKQVISASDVTIDVSDGDRARILAVVEQTSHVTEVNDEATFLEARRAAGQLKAMLEEIKLASRATKAAFDAVGTAILNVTHEVSSPVKDAQNRILGLLAGYVGKLEAIQKEKERLETEARRRIQEEADRKVRAAQAQRDRAQAELQAAQNEIERTQRRREAEAKEKALEQEQLARELAADVEELGQSQEPKRGLVPGGRVNHDHEFELVDVNATVRAGCWRLLRWELNIPNCKDSVRNQLELNPNAPPELPGIKITPTLTVSVKPSSRIK